MNQKGEMSSRKAWLLVLVSLIDDAIILGLIFLGFWYFQVKITWPVILALVAGMVIFFIIVHKAVIPALRRKKVTGVEGMIGAFGKVTETLDPSGMVEIKGEYWKATCLEGKIDTGRDIEVVSIKGLDVVVKEKQNE
jgi:membrane-bound serine protease (ClpP class)